MHAVNAAELEMTLLTALQCWMLAAEDPTAGRADPDRDFVRRWWRDEVEAACEAAGIRYGPASRLSDLEPEEPLGDSMRRERTTKHLQNVWRKMHSAVDRLGGLAR